MCKCNLIVDGFQFMPLGIVRLRAFRISTWVMLGATLKHVFTFARRADVSLRDVTIARDGKRVTQYEWRHAPEVRGGFWVILKKSVSWELDTERDGWHSLARGELCGECPTKWGRADEKAGIERLCLSPYVEKPLNSKVIKRFISELRSRYVLI